MSKLKKLNYIIIKYEEGKRRIYLNIEKIPTKVADDNAETCSNDSADSCTHNINSKYKKTNKIRGKIPYWLEHPEVCVSKPLSEEESKKIEELFKELKGKE